MVCVPPLSGPTRQGGKGGQPIQRTRSREDSQGWWVIFWWTCFFLIPIASCEYPSGESIPVKPNLSTTIAIGDDGYPPERPPRPLASPNPIAVSKSGSLPHTCAQTDPLLR